MWRKGIMKKIVHAKEALLKIGNDHRWVEYIKSKIKNEKWSLAAVEQKKRLPNDNYLARTHISSGLTARIPLLHCIKSERKTSLKPTAWGMFAYRLDVHRSCRSAYDTSAACMQAAVCHPVYIMSACGGQAVY